MHIKAVECHQRVSLPLAVSDCAIARIRQPPRQILMERFSLLGTTVWSGSSSE